MSDLQSLPGVATTAQTWSTPGLGAITTRSSWAMGYLHQIRFLASLLEVKFGCHGIVTNFFTHALELVTGCPPIETRS